MENKKSVIEFRGKRFYIVNDDNIIPEEQCKYCDFKDMCRQYTMENVWKPCGATFVANRRYLKYI